MPSAPFPTQRSCYESILPHMHTSHVRCAENEGLAYRLLDVFKGSNKPCTHSLPDTKRGCMPTPLTRYF